MVTDQVLGEAAQGTGIGLLVLFGSRARNQAHPHSDWDLGYLALPNESADIDRLRTRLTQTLGTDAIDLVNLAKANALLRMRAGAEGKALFESEPGVFLRFQEEVARFWCDVEPVLSLAYARILQEARTR